MMIIIMPVLQMRKQRRVPFFVQGHTHTEGHKGDSSSSLYLTLYPIAHAPGGLFCVKLCSSHRTAS